MSVRTVILLWIIAGYLCGSISWARIAGRLARVDIVGDSADGNPGGANGFLMVGKTAGVLVVLLDIAKGALLKVASPLGIDIASMIQATSVIEVGAHQWAEQDDSLPPDLLKLFHIDAVGRVLSEQGEPLVFFDLTGLCLGQVEVNPRPIRLWHSRTSGRGQYRGGVKIDH